MSKKYSTLEIEHHAQVATIWMNRPEVLNAFNEELISDLAAACSEIENDANIRVVVLAGRGNHFSAGADLNWMKRASVFGHDENLQDARRFAKMLRVLADLSKPTIARVQGAALGGGTGLAAACDMAIAAEDATFATSEVKFGIIPSVISPYVLRAIGPRHALRLFQTAERINAQRAFEIGLVGEVVPVDQLDQAVANLAQLLINGARLAQKAAKDLIAAIEGQPINEATSEETAQLIARQRATAEAKDGIAAFLEKRSPGWLAK